MSPSMVVLPALALACSAISLLLALQARAAPRGDRWRQHGDFSRLAWASAVYAGLAVAYSFAQSDATAAWVARLQIAAACWMLLNALQYVDHDLGVRRHASTRPLAVTSVIGLLLYELPGVGLTGRAHVSFLPWFGVPSVTSEVTTLGGIAFACLVAPLVGVLARYLAAWRRGTPYAGQHAAAFALMVGCGVNDSLSASGLIATPQLLPFGFALGGSLLGEVLSRRWRDDAGALDRLRASLEVQVEERGRALATAAAELVSVEKLAAVGGLAGGMAHRINNPVAVFSANLEYILASLKGGKPPPDLEAAVRESLDAARRVGATVRQLLVFSRAARGQGAEESFYLRPLAERAVALARKQSADSLEVVVELSPDLRAAGRLALLEQVLLELVRNATAAASDGARTPVRILGGREGAEVVLRIEDRGAGMDAEALRHLGEPFYASGPRVSPEGLGLAVTVHLVRSLGGRIEVESVPGKGTCVTVHLSAELGAAQPGEAAEKSAAPAA